MKKQRSTSNMEDDILNLQLKVNYLEKMLDDLHDYLNQHIASCKNRNSMCNGTNSNSARDPLTGEKSI